MLEPQSITSNNRPGTLCRLRKAGHYLFFKGNNLLEAVALFHAIKMGNAVRKVGEVVAELRSATKTPEEMGIYRREVIEEKLIFSQQIFSDLEIFK